MNNYDDIINIKHFEPKHKRMSRYNRAAQFAPFAALTGYEDSIKETARLTSKKIEIDESKKELLDFKLQLLKQNIKNKPLVKIMYFIKDNKKSGGSYEEIIGNITKIDEYKKNIIINNIKINFNDIIDINSDEINDIVNTI